MVRNNIIITMLVALLLPAMGEALDAKCRERVLYEKRRAEGGVIIDKIEYDGQPPEIPQELLDLWKFHRNY